jgi:hypothetical protein
VADDDALARARDEHQALVELARSSGRNEALPHDLLERFGRHADFVNRELLAELVTHVDAARYEDLGDALEEARQSWDEQEQAPHLRVGHDAGDEMPGRADPDSPGGALGASDEVLPESAEPNEPA